MSDDLHHVNDELQIQKVQFTRRERLRYHLSKPFFFVGMVLMPNQTLEIAREAMAADGETGDPEESDNYLDYIDEDDG